MKPQRLGTPLGRLLRRIDPEDRLRAYRVWSFWSDEVGPTIAGHAQPVGLRAGVLTVAVDAPTWLQELQFLKDKLRERLNDRLEQRLIDDIYFVSGASPSKAPNTSTLAKAATIGPPPEPLPEIRNPEIAAAFARIIAARARRASGDE